MVAAYTDNRIWVDTNRPFESLTISRPLRGFEVMSVHHSNRHWREAHRALTFALIHRRPESAAEWQTRGRSLTSKAGSIMGMEAGDVHLTSRVHSAPRGADFDVLRFAPAHVARAATALGVRGEFHLRTPAIRDDETFALLERLIGAVARGEDRLAVECLHAQALSAVVTRWGEQTPPSGVKLDPVRDFRLRRVKEYLNDNLRQRPTLEALEGVSGLTRFRLCGVFKSSYGLSIGEYWNAVRLTEAVRRLQRGRSPKLVVAELGFRSTSYLWRVFRAHYGMAPGAWLSMFEANDWLRRG